MKNLDFNSGKIGLTRDELIRNSYDRLAISTQILGYRISRLSTNGVSIIDGNGILFKNLSINEMLEGKSI